MQNKSIVLATFSITLGAFFAQKRTYSQSLFQKPTVSDSFQHATLSAADVLKVLPALAAGLVESRREGDFGAKKEIIQRLEILATELQKQNSMGANFKETFQATLKAMMNKYAETRNETHGEKDFQEFCAEQIDVLLNLRSSENFLQTKTPVEFNKVLSSPAL
jgi:hypothetical protein